MKECVQSFYLLNGRVMPCDSFDIRLINRGISVYEVVRLMKGRLLFLEDHIMRLYASLHLAGLEYSPDKEKIKNDLRFLLQHNPVREGNVKIVLNAPEYGTWNLLLYFVRHRYPSREEYAEGVKVITYPFERKDPNKKVWRPEFRKAVAETLGSTSAFEAVLTDAGGYIREASKANVFALLDGGLITPPDDMILPGITRKYITSICHKLGIPIEYKLLEIRELPRYTGMFLSGTSTKVLPVSRVDEMPVPMENNLIRKISEEYEKIIQEYFKPVKQS